MEYKKEMFRNIYWAYSNGQYSSQSEFEEALKNYHKEISGSAFSLNFNDIIFNHSKIVLQYVKYIDDDFEEPQVLLTADNNNAFTVGELLYKAHKEVGVHLENNDNCYFEGLTFATDQDPDYDGIPVYFLDTGS